MHDTPFASILGRIPSGVFILTALNGAEETGMLSSWVQQAGFDPPMVSVSVRLDRYLAEWLTNEVPFVLNALRDDQSQLLKHFGKGFEPAQNAFEGLKIVRDPRGVAVLSDSLGHLECDVTTYADSGDHRVFLAQIVGGRFSGAGQPLVHIRKNGTHY